MRSPSRRRRPSSRSSARSRSRRTTRTSSLRERKGRGRGPRSTSTRRSRRASRRTGRTWGSHEERVRRRGGELRRRRRVIAGELAAWSRRAAPRVRAAPPVPTSRWEAKAAHELFWPLRFAPLPNGEVVTFVAGRCVGGTTTINTKVAFRAHERDVAKVASRNGTDERRKRAVLRLRSRAVLRPGGVRARRSPSGTTGRRAYTVEARLPCARRGARVRALVHGRELHELRLLHPGLSLERRQVDDEHVHRGRTCSRGARAACERRGRAGADRRIRGDGRRVRRRVRRAAHRARRRGGRCRGRAHATTADPLGARERLDRPHLGVHPVRLVRALRRAAGRAHGLPDHGALCELPARRGRRLCHRGHDDPGSISFATTLSDENGPLWGPRLVEAMRRFRYWIGFLAMANDDNNSAVGVGEDGSGSRSTSGRPSGSAWTTRSGSAARSSEAAGATQVCWTGLVSTRAGQLPDGGRSRAHRRPERRVA